MRRNYPKPHGKCFGVSPYSFQWYQNGVILPTQTNQNLIINNVDATHAGSYTCVVSNSCGNTTSNACNVTILFNPVITLLSSPVSTCLGENITIHVSTTGSQPLSFQWYHGATPLVNNPPHITGATDSILTITGMTYSDTGYYHCIISNTCAMAITDSVLVNINIAPVITQQPDSLSICNNQNAQFTVSASGDSLYYQWQKTGVDIVGATNDTLSFTPATYLDTANYQCIVYNTCGTEISLIANLNMNIPPQIVNNPDSVSICDGQNTFFTVIATGDSLHYQWQKNGVNIAGATNSTLNFIPAHYSDTGNYVCVISNNCGTDTSANAHLNMNIPPAIVTQPHNLSKCLGQDATFSVIASGDSLNYQWLKNGNLIPGASQSTLILNNIQYSDTASYVCHIWNNCGEIYSNAGVLNINILPVITVQPNKTSSCLGDSETLYVVATGDSLKYQWRLNGIDISGAIQSSITINPVTLANTGDYTCWVYNNCGGVLSNVATLSVNLVPHIVSSTPKDFILSWV